MSTVGEIKAENSIYYKTYCANNFWTNLGEYFRLLQGDIGLQAIGHLPIFDMPSSGDFLAGKVSDTEFDKLKSLDPEDKLGRHDVFCLAACEEALLQAKVDHGHHTGVIISSAYGNLSEITEATLEARAKGLHGIKK
jgi:3-oxoacyl-(acyl-carrier-protein) synthase